DAVLATDGPIAAEVKQMTPMLEQLGLAWSGLGSFLETRNELFEIDTRFGQVGEDGIFTALDAAGVLTHHVEGVDDIRGAMDHPPGVPRAQVRGRLVRELSGHGWRYSCRWGAIWDSEGGRCVDLRDPVAASADWLEGPTGQAVVPGDFPDNPRARPNRPGWHWWRHLGSGRPDPVDLNEAALARRRAGQLDEAERLLRQA